MLLNIRPSGFTKSGIIRKTFFGTIFLFDICVRICKYQTETYGTKKHICIFFVNRGSDQACRILTTAQKKINDKCNHCDHESRWESNSLGSSKDDYDDEAKMWYSYVILNWECLCILMKVLMK